MFSTFITKVTRNDLASVLALQKICYLENAKRYNNFNIPPLVQTLEELEQEFEQCIFLKAQYKQSIIGSIRALSDSKTCYINRLFVHPTFQDHGIAKKLIRSIEDTFKNMYRFELFTGYKDSKNIALYTSLGYSKFKECIRHFDGMLFYYMEKCLK